jgi:hypothetical protein
MVSLFLRFLICNYVSILRYCRGKQGIAIIMKLIIVYVKPA